MKKFLLGMLVGGLLTGGVFLYIFLPRQEAVNQVTTTQISGAKVTHKKWNFSGKTVSFETYSEGAGISRTEISKSFIPEAVAWEEKRNSIQATVLYSPQESFVYSSICLSYFRRWDSFCLGGGIVFSKINIGFQAGGQYLF